MITDGVDPSLHIEYKHSHLKQYCKEGLGLRSELTINNPNDFDFTRDSTNCRPYARWVMTSIARS